MTLPAGGNNPPISLADINGEFGYGANLGAYRGKIFGRDNNTAGVFPTVAIDVSDFYATKKVVSGGPIYPATGNITIPPYKTITFYVIGGNGGTQGSAGTYVGGPSNGLATAPGDGGAGAETSFGSIISSAGGPANGGTATAQTVTLTNPALGGTGPASGSTLAVTVGSGGSAGGGGPIYGWVVQDGNFGTYVLSGYAASGSAGASGSAYYSWTGEA